MELTTPEYTVKDYLQLSKAVNAVEEGAWSESALRKAREALMSEPVSDRRDENIAQIDRALEGSPDGYSLGDLAVHFYCLSTGSNNWREPAAIQLGTSNKLKCIPPGATHYQVVYQQLEFFKRQEVRRFNDVSEAWQTDTHWFYWNLDAWTAVGSGFSSRLCELIGDLS